MELLSEAAPILKNRKNKTVWMTARPCIAQGRTSGGPPVHFSIISQTKHDVLRKITNFYNRRQYSIKLVQKILFSLELIFLENFKNFRKTL